MSGHPRKMGAQSNVLQNYEKCFLVQHKILNRYSLFFSCETRETDDLVIKQKLIVTVKFLIMILVK